MHDNQQCRRNHRKTYQTDQDSSGYEPKRGKRLGAPGPGGENVEGHQGLMPATQVSGLLPPGRVGPVEASEGNPGED